MKVCSFPARIALLNLALAAAFPSFGQTQLADVVVTAARVAQPLTDVLADVSIIDRDQIDRSGATGLVDLLSRQPGIEFARNGGPGGVTSLFLRGAASNHTAVFIDGVRVDVQSGSGGAAWEVLPLAMIDRIEVLRGPAGAVYGSDAMAGVVQIFTRKGEQAFQPYAGIGLGSQRTRKLDAGFSGAQDGFDYALGVAREFSDGFNAKVGGNPDRDGYSNHSASARFGVDLGTTQRLEANWLQSHIDTRYDSSYTADDRSLHQLQLVGLNWLSKWRETYSTRFSVSQSEDRYETLPSPYLTETRVRNYLLQNEIRADAHLLTAALERREDELGNSSLAAGTADRSQNALALGYGYKQQAHALQLNLRHDDDSEFGGKDTGSIAYAYEFAPSWRATVSAGTAFRAPTLYQRFSPYGDASLKPENGRNLEFGLRYAAGASRLGAVLYQNRISNLITFAGPGACVSSYGCYENTSRARLEGLTLSGARQLGSVRVSASLDWQNPRDLGDGRPLARRARERAVLGADTRYSNWSLGAELELSGKRYDYNYDKSRTYELGGYGLLNLHASRMLSRDLNFLARVDNVGDKVYQLANGYNTAPRTLYVGLKWSPQ